MLGSPTRPIMNFLRVPLLLFTLPAALIAFAPARQELFLLDREAVAAGQVWRLWSGHWVHFSTSHLVWNLAVLFATGVWLERLRPGLLLRHTLLAAPLIGVGVLAFEPALQRYGGLSGLATGAVVLLALHQVRASGSSRWLWAGVLALVAFKVVGETQRGGSFFAGYDSESIRTSTTAHAAGAVAGLLHYSVRRFAGSRFLKMTPPGPVTDSRRQGSGHYP